MTPTSSNLNLARPFWLIVCAFSIRHCASWSSCSPSPQQPRYLLSAVSTSQSSSDLAPHLEISFLRLDLDLAPNLGRHHDRTGLNEDRTDFDSQSRHTLVRSRDTEQISILDVVSWSRFCTWPVFSDTNFPVGRGGLHVHLAANQCWQYVKMSWMIVCFILSNCVKLQWNVDNLTTFGPRSKDNKPRRRRPERSTHVHFQ